MRNTDPPQRSIVQDPAVTIAVLRKRMEWQPIDAVPDDCTRALVCVGKWVGTADRTVADSPYWVDDAEELIVPTHFQLLPGPARQAGGS